MKLYSKINSAKGVNIKICEVSIFEKKVIGNEIAKKRFLCGLFKTREELNFKDYYIFGIKFFRSHRQSSPRTKVAHVCSPASFASSNSCQSILQSEIIDAVRTEIRSTVNAALKALHIEQFKNHHLVVYQHQKVFPQFKDIHRGATGVLLGCAPSLNYYKKISGSIHFGVNTSFSCVKPDYWFSIDSTSVRKLYKELNTEGFIKFIGQALVSSRYRGYRRGPAREVTFIPDCVIESFSNAYKFYIDHPSLVICRDISLQPLPDLGSAIFSALSFAIYSGCKRIYVVGCDNIANGYFNGEKQKDEWKTGRATSMLLDGWKRYKDHIEIFHPDVELISVNPVGLKGLFQDVYTKEYLQVNPDIKKEIGSKLKLLEDIES